MPQRRRTCRARRSCSRPAQRWWRRRTRCRSRCCNCLNNRLSARQALCWTSGAGQRSEIEPGSLHLALRALVSLLRRRIRHPAQIAQVAKRCVHSHSRWQVFCPRQRGLPLGVEGNGQRKLKVRRRQHRHELTTRLVAGPSSSDQNGAIDDHSHKACTKAFRLHKYSHPVCDLPSGNCRLAVPVGPLTHY